MNYEAEVRRLTKENDNFRKIIRTQQNTINRLVDYFILGKKDKKLLNNPFPTKKG